jgi:hypothetical protein
VAPDSVRRLDPERLPRVRAAAQLLHRPPEIRDAVEVARTICGAQAQDRYGGPLTFRSRSRRLTAADVDRARTEERSLLRTWVMRKTIHLVASDDAGWLLPLFEPAIERWSRRRLGQLGMPPGEQDKALRAIQRMLEREGPLTPSEVAERLIGAGVELNNQTRLHIIGVAVTSGIACLGPDRGASACLVLRDDWLGKPPRFDHGKAIAELARRYLRAFGPATDRDFARWSGLGLTEVRSGLAAIEGELAEWRVGDHTLVSLRGERKRIPRPGQVRLLGAFDTYMLGYGSREFAVPPQRLDAVNEGGGGLIRPVIVEDGRVIGIWRSARRDGRAEIELRPFDRLTQEGRASIEAEVEDISRFEGAAATLVPG